jgi:hypothetical protein
LSETESALRGYYFELDGKKQIEAGGKNWYQTMLGYKGITVPPEKENPIYERLFNMKLEQLTKIFVDAVNNRDAKKIAEIAEGINLLKWHEGEVEKFRTATIIASITYNITQHGRLKFMIVSKAR